MGALPGELMDDKTLIDGLWKVLSIVGGAAATAWGTVLIMFNSRVSSLEETSEKHKKDDELRHEDLRKATAVDLRRIEDKIDRNHNMIMDKLLDMQRGE